MKINLKCPQCQEYLLNYDTRDRFSNPALCKTCKYVWVYDGNKKFWIKAYKVNKIRNSSSVRFS